MIPSPLRGWTLRSPQRKKIEKSGGPWSRWSFRCFKGQALPKQFSKFTGGTGAVSVWERSLGADDGVFVWTVIKVCLFRCVLPPNMSDTSFGSTGYLWILCSLCYLALASYMGLYQATRRILTIIAATSYQPTSNKPDAMIPKFWNLAHMRKWGGWIWEPPKKKSSESPKGPSSFVSGDFPLASLVGVGTSHPMTVFLKAGVFGYDIYDCCSVWYLFEAMSPTTHFQKDVLTQQWNSGLNLPPTALGWITILLKHIIVEVTTTVL